MSLREAIDRARFADPVGAIEAFNRGAELARAEGFDDTPMPHDAYFEYELPDGRVIRVLAAERTEDHAAAEAELAHDVFEAEDDEDALFDLAHEIMRENRSLDWDKDRSHIYAEAHRRLGR